MLVHVQLVATKQIMMVIIHVLAVGPLGYVMVKVLIVHVIVFSQVNKAISTMKVAMVALLCQIVHL